MFSKSTISSFILYLGFVKSPLKIAVAQELAYEDLHGSSMISLVEFQGMLYSEVNTAIDNQEQSPPKYQIHQDQRLQGRFLREEDVPINAQKVWNQVVQQGWHMSQLYSDNFHSTQSRRRSLSLDQVEDDDVKKLPFIVCSHSSLKKSGFQRLEPMLKHTRSSPGDISVILNESNKTCYHVPMEYNIAQEIRKQASKLANSSDIDRYTIMPMTDIMKIQFGTMALISDESWTVPKTSPPNDWERLIRVGLSAGVGKNLNESMVTSFANDVISDIRSSGRKGAQNRRRRLSEGNQEEVEDDHIGTYSSISNVFSLTATSEHQNGRYLRQHKRRSSSKAKESENLWSRALELGLEADHSCEVMFNNLDLSVHYDNKGFDIILNPMRNNMNNHDTENTGTNHEYNDGIENECSASNKHCVASFIMALSTHPLVLSVESEGPIMANDHEAQWITQSKSEDYRPLRDIGITGQDQIISIVDSGLDIDHEFFGPTDAKVFDVSEELRRA